jgi:DNA-binding ferritin-like protein (Dps family)
VTDELLKLHLKLSPQEALEKIKTLQQEVQKVNGLFISIFHNAILSDMESNKDWADVYEEMLQFKMMNLICIRYQSFNTSNVKI